MVISGKVNLNKEKKIPLSENRSKRWTQNCTYYEYYILELEEIWGKHRPGFGTHSG